ncbi:MAG: hypothetical protein AAGN35_21425 [Bacteroidota bacterium]
MAQSPFAEIPDPQTPPQRPAVITVFAILSIIGCALAILGMFISNDLFTQDLTVQPPSPPDWIKYAGGALAIVKLIGAIQMLKMQRLGFYLYAAGEAATAILGIISARIVLDLLSGFDIPGPVDLRTTLFISTGISLVLSVVFIGVYASQLKNMR